MAQAVAGKPLSRPYMGIHFRSINRSLADQLKLPVMVGALVGGVDEQGNPTKGVDAGTPADKAGIKDGDIIDQRRWQGHRRGAPARRRALASSHRATRSRSTSCAMAST